MECSLKNRKTTTHISASGLKYYRPKLKYKKRKYNFCRVCFNAYCREVFGGGTAFCSKPCENAYYVARRCRIRERMPKWITVDQIAEMALMYLNCPQDNDVDHIIPLKHKRVSGLHVPWNLQHLDHEENIRKGNSFES